LSEVLSKDAQVEKADLLLNGRDLGKSEAEMRDWGTALANSEAHVTIRLWTRLLRACGIYIDARPLVVETDGTMDVGKGLWASLEQSEGRQVWRVVDVGASLGRFTDPTIVDRDVTWPASGLRAMVAGRNKIVEMQLPDVGESDPIVIVAAGSKLVSIASDGNIALLPLPLPVGGPADATKASTWPMDMARVLFAEKKP